LTAATQGTGLRGRGRTPWPLAVFSVDDCSAQLSWKASPAEGLRLEVGDVVAEVASGPKAELVLDREGARRYRQLLAGYAGATGPPADAAAGTALASAGHAGSAPGPSPGRWARQYHGGWRQLDRAWPGGPGSVVLEGLAPGTTYDVIAQASGVPAFRAARLRTLDPPPGALLCRFGTVSDVHIGERHFGVMGRIHDPQPLGLPGQGSHLYPFRALEAAIDEAAAWGAELLVVKGDLTRQTTPSEVRDAGALLAASPVPVEVVLGNHDNKRGVNVRALLEQQGLRVPWGPSAVDLPGIRLVLVGTVHGDPDYHRGELPAGASEQVSALAAAAPGAAWVALHHPPEMHRYPLAYPPGIPFAQGRQLLDGLARSGTPTMVSCGHRHRNRRYDYGPVVLSEVSSTKDYPGVWAGYKVYEGGIMQVTRRVARQDVITWTESTRRAMNGQWGRWSPGRLSDRCFSVAWASPPAWRP
jgi:3',5'-cyclic-AMP phosphodiesterase